MGRGKRKLKYQMMSRAEREAYIAERTVAGWGPSQIARELEYAGHSRVSQLLRTERVKALIEQYQRKVMTAAAQKVGEVGTLDDDEPEAGDVALPELKDLALVRLGEVLRKGTFLGKPVDTKDMVRAMWEVLDRDPETAKKKASAKDSGGGAGGGAGLLTEERLRELEEGAGVAPPDVLQ